MNQTLKNLQLTTSFSRVERVDHVDVLELARGASALANRQ